MSSNSDLDVTRRQISTLVDDVRVGEQHFRDQGVEIADPDEWLQLRDIVARIERKLLAGLPAREPAE